MIRHSIKIGNAPRGSRNPAAAPAKPVLTFDAGIGLWYVTFDGPTPAQWKIWKRCNYAPDWEEQGELTPSEIPTTTDTVLAGDELWWQIKFVGADDAFNPVTPYRAVVSSSLSRSYAEAGSFGSSGCP